MTRGDNSSDVKQTTPRFRGCWWCKTSHLPKANSYSYSWRHNSMLLRDQILRIAPIGIKEMYDPLIKTRLWPTMMW